jgi:transcriptional regulator with GAF, ATPase, and Fis domain
MYVNEFDTVNENMINALFKGRNPKQTFVEQFNKSLGVSVSPDNSEFEGGAVVTNSNRRVQPLQEDYSDYPQQEQQQEQQYYTPNKRTPLTGILPPEIIESIQKKKNEPIPDYLTGGVGYGAKQHIQENTRMDLMTDNKVQGKIKTIQQPSAVYNNVNKDALSKLAESVNILTKIVESNGNVSQSTQLIQLTIDGKKFEGSIKQTKKGQILFILDDEHCFILTPSQLKKYK